MTISVHTRLGACRISPIVARESPVGVRFFDLLRRIVGLLNEEEREIWPDPAFPRQYINNRLALNPTGS